MCVSTLRGMKTRIVPRNAPRSYIYNTYSTREFLTGYYSRQRLILCFRKKNARVAKTMGIFERINNMREIRILLVTFYNVT